MRIYLAGFINGNTLQQCIEWRKRIVTHYLMRAWDIIWLDPMNGHAVGSITPEGFKSDIPGTAFVDRDIKCVEESDLIIANLDNFEEMDKELTNKSGILQLAKDIDKIKKEIDRTISLIIEDNKIVVNLSFLN